MGSCGIIKYIVNYTYMELIMKLGEKIKKLRIAKLMTQSELAGGEITRNMLSRIEHGAAQPSLDTLKYLADRLGVTMGYLLSDGDDEIIYVKHTQMSNIKTSYLAGDHRICRDMCLRLGGESDDEIGLILAECTLGIAIEEFEHGRLREACEYFDLAIEACTRTVYNTSHVFAICATYFKYMRTISATLSSNQIDENDVPIWASLSDSFCLYAGAFLSMCDKQVPMVKPHGSTPYALHIEAMEHIAAGEYRQAHNKLHEILVSEMIVPEPMLYFIFGDLENCCKQMEDFKGAYEYSINKVGLLQKLLTQ